MNIRAVLALILVTATAAGAQRQIVRSPIGPLFRYNGDTIWVERDSTVTQVVSRGDTVSKISTVNGAVTYRVLYVADGDLARTIDSRDGTGARTPDSLIRSVPRMLLTSERDMMQGAVRLINAQASAPQGLPSNEAPRSPAQPITYLVSFGVTIVQHLDTALLVRGCIGRGKLDTTTFVFTGDTTVQRVAPARTFGHAMVVSLFSTMYNANVRKSLASRGGRSDIPSGPNNCSVTPPRLVGEGAIYQTGIIRRYHNDTLWIERDTSTTRTVMFADTVERTLMMNDKVQSTARYVLEGDSARVVEWMMGDGTQRTAAIGTRTPSSIVLTDRRMLESALSMANLRAQSPLAMNDGLSVVMGARSNPVPKPASPATPTTYELTPLIRLIQMGDTVRFVQACPGRANSDTTMFVFFGADSVKRLNPARTFGPSMVASLVGHMYMTTLRQSMAARDGTPLPTAPFLSPPCK